MRRRSTRVRDRKAGTGRETAIGQGDRHDRTVTRHRQRGLPAAAAQHVAGGGEEFFVRVQECYERFDPATPPGLRPPAAAEVDTSGHVDEVARTGRFGPVVLRRHAGDLPYTTAEYLSVLRTHSGHRALPARAREGLLECVAALIDRRYGGRITKRYLTELRVSRTLPAP